jgi:hypothetical protein
VSIEHLAESELAGETEVPGENLPHCHFVHQKSQMTWSGIEPGPPRWEATSNTNLYKPRMTVSIEHLAESELAGETEVPGENLPHCHFVHQKS